MSFYLYARRSFTYVSRILLSWRFHTYSLRSTRIVYTYDICMYELRYTYVLVVIPCPYSSITWYCCTGTSTYNMLFRFCTDQWWLSYFLYVWRMYVFVFKSVWCIYVHDLTCDTVILLYRLSADLISSILFHLPSDKCAAFVPISYTTDSCMPSTYIYRRDTEDSIN